MAHSCMHADRRILISTHYNHHAGAVPLQQEGAEQDDDLINWDYVPCSYKNFAEMAFISPPG